MSANLETLAAWAARTSLEALPLALAAFALVYWRQCQPRWRTWLLALFFIRLALPAAPEAPWRPTLNPPVALAKRDAATATTPRSTATGQESIDWKRALAITWGLGCAGALSWLVASHVLVSGRVRRQARVAPPGLQTLVDRTREEQGVAQKLTVWCLPNLTTIAVFGWYRPCLLVPEDLDRGYTAEQIRGMLLHELAHVRRRDVLWSWLALILCAVHWFNPLAWLAFRRFCTDRELICDAAALAQLDSSGRYSYGDALLRSLELAPIAAAPSLAPFFRIHPEIKQRLLMITKPTNSTVWSRLIAVSLVIAVALVTFTTARAQADGAPQKESELDKYKRENAERKAQRDGEVKREAPRDGDVKKEGARDGATKREGARDGEARKSGPRDGEARKRGPRDGEMKKEGPRDGERTREGTRDGDTRKREGARDGEAKKEGARDGDKPREGDKQ